MGDFITDDFFISKIILACYVGKGCGENIHKNRPSHGLALHRNGKKKYLFADSTSLIVEEGDIIYLPKYSDYVVENIASGECYAINFDISEDFHYMPFKFSTKNFNAFLQLFKSAEYNWMGRKPGYREKCLSGLYCVIALLKEEMNRAYITKSKAQILKPAMTYISDNYTFENISIPCLAGLCGISDVYFRSVFKSAYGISPNKYIQKLKLARAAELLNSGMYSVHQAAEMSGFFDDSYFCREFKKAYGMAPTYFSNKTARQGTVLCLDSQMALSYN